MRSNNTIMIITTKMIKKVISIVKLCPISTLVMMYVDDRTHSGVLQPIEC